MFLVLRFEKHPPNRNLEDRAKAFSRQISKGGYQFRLSSHDYTTIADRPAYIVSLQYAESVKGAPERNDLAIVDGGEVLYSVQFGAPLANYDSVSDVFNHAIESLSVKR